MGWFRGEGPRHATGCQLGPISLCAPAMAYFDRHGKPGYFRDVTRHFAPQAGVLDIGCGTAWLAECFPNYTGVDSSPEIVESAVKRGLSVALADVAGSLPFEDEQFDGVVLKDVLEHLLHPTAAVREAHRVLKPGGRLFASSPDAQRWAWDDYTHRRPFTRRGFRLLFADAGFEVEALGYESVMPGTGIVAGWTKRKRRPRTLAAAAWLPLVRRNVWLVARRRAGRNG
jgi:SAM-dependent methyltransferase